MLPQSPHLARDRYQLVRQLGEGASACVFEAFDSALGRAVALKRMKTTLPDTAAFLAEARILARLQHPHIVEIYDIGGDAQGVPYFVMELVEESLGMLLDRKKTLTAEETLGLLLPIAGALAYVHDRGLTHRDLKPANIAVSTPTGRALHGKLLDFGIARARDLGEGAVVHGTPAYMAPEQLEGSACGPAADVWSLGVVAYQCLTGVLPFEPWFVNEQGQVRRPVSWLPAKLAPEALAKVPPVLQLVLERALEPNLVRRYADMREFARALISAGIQAQIAVPSDPDPVGLPDAPSWYAQLDYAHTQPQPARAHTGRAQPALAPPALTQPTPAPPTPAQPTPAQPTELAAADSSASPRPPHQPRFAPASALGPTVTAATPAAARTGSPPARSRRWFAMRETALFVLTLFGVLAGGAWWQWGRPDQTPPPSDARRGPAVAPLQFATGVAGGAAAPPPVRLPESARPTTLEPQTSSHSAREPEGALPDSAREPEAALPDSAREPEAALPDSTHHSKGALPDSARDSEGVLRPPVADVAKPARRRSRETRARRPLSSTVDGAHEHAPAPTTDSPPAASLQLERNWEW